MFGRDKTRIGSEFRPGESSNRGIRCETPGRVFNDVEPSPVDPVVRVRLFQQYGSVRNALYLQVAIRGC